MSGRARPAPWWTALSALTAVLVALVCGVVLWAFMPPVVFFPYFALASSALVIPVRMDEALLKALNARAEREHVSRSEAIREAIRAWTQVV